MSGFAQRINGALIVALSLIGTPMLASADIIGTSGDILVLATPPGSVEVDALESDDHAFLFLEQASVVLPVDLRLNVDTEGVYGDRLDLPFPVPTLPAGTPVSSFLLHADPATRGISYQGRVDFDSAVLGVILGGVLLEESDFLGPPGTTYPADAFFSGRGLALNGADFLIVGPQSLFFNIRTGSLIDQVRVITAAPSVPEPATAMLLGTGLAYLTIRRRRARSAHSALRPRA